MLSTTQIILIAISCVIIYITISKIYLIRKNARPTIDKPSTNIEPKEYIVPGLFALFLLIIMVRAIFSL